MKRKYQIGEYVVISEDGDLAEGMLAVVEEHHPFYPSQKWYEVRYVTPLTNAPWTDEFPRNATHGMYREIELCSAEPDDFAEPPTVGNEVI